MARSIDIRSRTNRRPHRIRRRASPESVSAAAERGAEVIHLAGARVRHGPAEKRIPVPEELLALAEVGIEIEAEPGGRFWQAVEARMEAYVRGEVPRGARTWKVSWDAARFEIVLRWKV